MKNVIFLNGNRKNEIGLLLRKDVAVILPMGQMEERVVGRGEMITREHFLKNTKIILKKHGKNALPVPRTPKIS